MTPERGSVAELRWSIGEFFGFHADHGSGHGRRCLGKSTGLLGPNRQRDIRAGQSRRNTLDLGLNVTSAGRALATKPLVATQPIARTAQAAHVIEVGTVPSRELAQAVERMEAQGVRFRGNFVNVDASHPLIGEGLGRGSSCPAGSNPLCEVRSQWRHSRERGGDRGRSGSAADGTSDVGAAGPAS